MDILYKSQQEALHSVESHYFPRYAENNTWGKYVCNVIHDTLHIVSDVKAYLFEVASAVSNVAFAFFNQFVPLEQSYEFVYPVNIVNGQRHIVTLPRTWEKSLGDHFLCPLSTWGLLNTDAAFDGERLQVTVDNVLTKLLTPNENKELLNPQLAPIAFFDNIEWGVKTAMNYVLSLVEDIPPEDAPVEMSGIFDYKMEVVKDSSLNAFSLPGGKMVVFSGLIEEMDHSLTYNPITESKITFKDGSVATVQLDGVTREDILAALIGHEITHAASRHAFTFSLESFLNEISSFLELGNSWGCYLFSAFVSRKQEFECDVTGAYLAFKADYDPRGALYLEELFLKKQPAAVQRIYSLTEPLFSHPHNNKRLKAVFTAISTFAPESLRGKTVWSEARAHSYDLNRLSPALQVVQRVKENLTSEPNL
jgi:hypothetical protein